jgi:hypothetical protein
MDKKQVVILPRATKETGGRVFPNGKAMDAPKIEYQESCIENIQNEPNVKMGEIIDRQ